jgi:CTP-dependent riboflavin kinase
MANRELKVKGKVVSGLGEGVYFIQLDWVKSQFKNKFGFDPYPGTFNVKLSDEELERYGTLNKYRGVKIIPPSAQYVSAKCFPVSIAKSVKGVLAIPMLEDYPPDLMEIVAPVPVREILGLQEEDVVEVVITL